MFSKEYIKQAPAVVYNGEKQHEDNKWTCMYPVELQKIIFNSIDYRSSAELRVMLALVGCAEGFKISEKWIEEHTGVSHSSYIRARQNLEKRGWITHTKEESIEINFDAIYACGEGSTVEPSTNHERSTVNNESITVKPSERITVEPSRGSTVKPIIKEYNKKEIQKKEKENIFFAGTACAANAASAAPARIENDKKLEQEQKAQKEANEAAYHKEMIALNDEFFDGVQAYKAKYGNDYTDKEDYKAWRDTIGVKTNALRAKYHIGQK